jgi:DNA-binding Lrp family transcriptional regulator
MAEISSKIREVFEKVKKAHAPYRAVLRRINNGYYVYIDTATYNKETKNAKIHSKYLGRITEEGKFIEKQHTTSKDRLAMAVELIEANGGKVIMQKQKEEDTALRQVQQQTTAINKVDASVLMALSMNGAMTYASLARRLGMSETGMDYKVKHLEELYGIKYVPELDMEALGYSKYLLMVKFTSDKPDPALIKEVFSKDPRVLLAALVTGDYDLIVYFFAKDNKEVTYFVHETRIETKLRSYNGMWYAAPFFDSYNFVPLRQECYVVFKEKVWKKSSKRLHPGEVIFGTVKEPAPKKYNRSTDITENEYNVLCKLASGNRVNFKQIGKQIGISPISVSYAFDSLRTKGFLKRLTINMEKLPIRYNALLFTDIIDGEKFNNSRKELLMEIVEDSDRQTGRYVLVGDIENPHSVVFVLPVFDKDDAIVAEQRIRKMVKGVIIRSSMVTNILVGNFLYRKFDNGYTNQHKILNEEYKTLESRELINYDK